MKLIAENKTGSIKVGVVVLVLAALGTLPIWGTTAMIPIFTLIMIYLALGQMWNLLAGYTGLFSLGQHGFIGLGGYSLAVVSVRFGLPLIFGFVLAAVVSVLFALAISVPIFKIKGVYFTIGTWIVSICLFLFFSIWAFTNMGIGMVINATFRLSTSTIYFVSLGVAVASVALVYVLLRTRFGLGLMAMRDDDVAAEVRGVQLYKTKLKIFLISSGMTGVIGAAMYMNLGFILPESGFDIGWTIAMVFIVIIGGIGTVEGPIIGAVIYVLLNQWLFNFPGYSMLIQGAIAIVIIMVAPKGIMGFVNKYAGLEFFSIRRKAKTNLTKNNT